MTIYLRPSLYVGDIENKVSLRMHLEGTSLGHHNPDFDVLLLKQYSKTQYSKNPRVRTYFIIWLAL